VGRQVKSCNNCKLRVICDIYDSISDLASNLEHAVSFSQTIESIMNELKQRIAEACDYYTPW